MLPRPRTAFVAQTFGALTATGALALSGCAASDSPPSVVFGSDVSTTPGMPGMGSMPMPSMPQRGTSTSTAAPVSGDAVAIENFAFVPPSLTVPVGHTVTWTNRDEEPHTVAADDGSFHSPGLDSAAIYAFTFTKSGTFEYVCSIHPLMHGAVVVTP